MEEQQIENLKNEILTEIKSDLKDLRMQQAKDFIAIVKELKTEPTGREIEQKKSTVDFAGIEKKMNDILTEYSEKHIAYLENAIKIDEKRNESVNKIFKEHEEDLKNVRKDYALSVREIEELKKRFFSMFRSRHALSIFLTVLLILNFMALFGIYAKR